VLFFGVVDMLFGHAVVLAVAFGSVSLMAIKISATFLWLWLRRETPLALGMSFSWAGAASFFGWLWVDDILDHPPAMSDPWPVFVFMGLYFVGAILHFTVIQRTTGFSLFVVAAPLLASIVVASIISLPG
jgi:hypothetical protein